VEGDLLPVRSDQGVLLGVEGQVAGNGERRDKLGGGNESVGGGVSVVTGGKVAVVGCDDGVGLTCADPRKRGSGVISTGLWRIWGRDGSESWPDVYGLSNQTMDLVTPELHFYGHFGVRCVE
jgi:hypothetical protein